MTHPSQIAVLQAMQHTQKSAAKIKEEFLAGL